MILFNRLIYIMLGVFVILNTACQKDPEVGGTAAKPLAGDWWVQARDSTGEFIEEIGGDAFHHIIMYNTASNSASEIWFDDSGFWGMKGKIAANPTSLTFSGQNVTTVTDYDPVDASFSVTDGKIIKNGAKGPGSKSQTDSIFYKIKYSDYPTTLYMSGYKRTGFEEDEH